MHVTKLLLRFNDGDREVMDLVIPLVYQELVTLGELVVLPTQRNLRVSNCAAWVPIACAAIILVMIMCRVVPSFGATVASQFAAVIPPAPGMLRGMMVGSPGIWRAMKRAIRRPR